MRIEPMSIGSIQFISIAHRAFAIEVGVGSGSREVRIKMGVFKDLEYSRRRMCVKIMQLNCLLTVF